MKTIKPTRSERTDEEGWLHAEWCAWTKSRDLDNCDCNPCTCCEGHGRYGGDDGEPIDCVQCGDDPERTWRRPKSPKENR